VGIIRVEGEERRIGHGVLTGIEEALASSGKNVRGGGRICDGFPTPDSRFVIGLNIFVSMMETRT
jgi:hypothetical protein